MNNKIMMKVCSKCKIEKELLNFSKGNDKDGLTYWCKECFREHRRKYYQKNKKEINVKQKIYVDKNKEKVKNYQKQYFLENKDKILLTNKIYSKKNRKKVLKQKKLYYKNNKEKFKIYYEERREEKKEYNKLYRQKNRKKLNQKLKERKKRDLCFKLHKNITTSIWQGLKSQNSFKQGSIFQFLSYTIQELKEHLEKQFELWMNWDNWGKYEEKRKTWQIDHIIPQSLLSYDSMEHENFQKCWALENLRPLDSLENIKKRNKII